MSTQSTIIGCILDNICLAHGASTFTMHSNCFYPEPSLFHPTLANLVSFNFGGYT